MAIFLPNRWRTQPINSVEVDWNNPLARNLVHLWNNGYDAAQQKVRRTFAHTSGSWRTNAVGMGAYPTNQATNSGIDLGAALPTSGALSLSAIFTNLSTGQEAWYAAAADTAAENVSYGIYWDSWPTPIGIGAVCGSWATTYAIAESERRTPKHFTFSSDGTRIVSKLDLRAPIVQTGGFARSTAGSNLHVGSRPLSAWTGAQGVINLVAAWSRAISDAEIEEFHKNPWQLFRPTLYKKIFAQGITSLVTSISVTATTGAVVGIGDYIDLEVTALKNGVPAVGVLVTGSSSNTDVATGETITIGPPINWNNSLSGWTYSADTLDGVASAKFNETATTAGHQGYPNDGIDSDIGDVHRIVANIYFSERAAGSERRYWEIRPFDGAAGFVQLNDDGTLDTEWNPSTGIYGHKITGVRQARVWSQATCTVDNANIRTRTEGSSATYLGDINNYIIINGWTEILNQATTNSSGKATIRVWGRAAGSANITATAYGVTSDPLTVYVQMVSAISEPSANLSNYIVTYGRGKIVEFDMIPITQPVANTNMIANYIAGLFGNANVKIEILDPRVP